MVSCSQDLLEEKRIEMLSQYQIACQVLSEVRGQLFSKSTEIISLLFKIIASVISNMQRLLNVAGQKEDKNEENLIRLKNEIQRYFDELQTQIYMWLTSYLPQLLAYLSFSVCGWIYKWDQHEFEVSNTFKAIFR